MNTNSLKGILGGATALVLSLNGAAHATDMTMSTWLPPAHILSTELEGWAASLEEASDGSLNVDIYPSQQLGAAPDHYDMARDGIVDMALVSPAYNAGRFPIFAYVEIPFSFGNSTTGTRAFHEWFLDYAGAEMGDVKVCLITLHAPGLMHFAKEGVETPEDLSGLRMRPAGPTVAEWLTQQGANIVPSSLPEVRELADRNVIDGTTLPWDMADFGIHEALSFHLDMPMYVGAQVHVINPSFYDSLSDDERAAVDSHCTPEWSERISTAWFDEAERFRVQLSEDDSQTIYAISADQKAAWRATSDPVRDAGYAAVSAKYADIDGAEIGAMLQEKLEAAGAAYDSVE
ncbi:C4-dicarboxylate ABC transporter [Maritimibacter sp. DP07]|uniref:C4-dicarboxylate ABC transporter n=1 Tax=Maritimibacter harenae TaxID=2606218 RepID=A0A845M6C1_9RHOB|nr:TRAP transporter substrate-binding protein [Maritimibacter harenae]MZR11701.1 C4-dicarboxylate ABC transporter [Maritimibacter harenae]